MEQYGYKFLAAVDSVLLNYRNMTDIEHKTLAKVVYCTSLWMMFMTSRLKQYEYQEYEIHFNPIYFFVDDFIFHLK